jgi:hypothetical protein
MFLIGGCGLGEMNEELHENSNCPFSIIGEPIKDRSIFSSPKTVGDRLIVESKPLSWLLIAGSIFFSCSDNYKITYF